MKRALKLAELGGSNVAPNPKVGCVLVNNDRIIGEGYHRKYGEPHAEVNAIRSVQHKEKLANSTAYVSLEPCSHHGKTPPCVDLLLQHKIPRVVIGVEDPFKKVSGNGIEKLKKNGVEVKLGVCLKEATEINKKFFTFHQLNRPYIILKWAVSKDGYLGVNDKDLSLEKRWITNERTDQLTHQWRAEEDAILVGTKTAQLDQPKLDCRHVFGKNPKRILIDNELVVDDEFYSKSTSTDTFILNLKKGGEKNRLKWIKYDENDFFDTLFQLCNDIKIQSLIVEGGAKTLQSFIDANLWDEARILRGEVEFQNGVKAPLFNHKADYMEYVQNDSIGIYYNKSR